MVHVFSHNLPISLRSQIIFYISTEKQNMSLLNKVYNKPLILQLPTTFCKELLCVYFINHTKPGKQLRINITGLSYQGKNDYLCKYGGLAVPEINLIGKTPERPAICQNDQGSATENKLYYSSRSSAILVLYWYKGLSSIKANITITEPECKAIQLAICKLYSLCGLFHSFHNFWFCKNF